MPHNSIRTKIKKYIVAGLLVTIPTTLTLFLFSFVNSRLDDSLIPLINNLMRKIGIEGSIKQFFPGTGFIVLFILIIITGLFATNWLGKKVVGFGDTVVEKIPFVRSIYITIKKLVATCSETGSPKFQKAVILDYPRKGLQSFGIICCDASGEIESKLGAGFVNIFIPTTPNPTSGFTVILQKEKIVPLDFQVDQGLKMIVSVGMYNPKISLGSSENKPSI